MKSTASALDKSRSLCWQQIGQHHGRNFIGDKYLRQNPRQKMKNDRLQNQPPIVC
jgi:hypothetical protein